MKADTATTAEGDPMGNQGYRANYLAAFEGANHQLESIYSEYHELQRRKEKLEGVLMALEPFLQSATISIPEVHNLERPEPIPAYTEQYSAPEPAFEPQPQPERFVEPVPAPVFASVDESLDPLQLRINRALGLAVA
jgi:hypothetical protein